MVLVLWLVAEPRTRDVIPAVFFLYGNGHESKICNSVNQVIECLETGEGQDVVVVSSMLEAFTYSPWVWSVERQVSWHGVEYARLLLGESTKHKTENIRLYVIHPTGDESVMDPYGSCRKEVENLGGVVVESIHAVVQTILRNYVNIIKPPAKRIRPVYRFVIARHAQRLDEVLLNWSDTAERPQDTPISSMGRLQSLALGKWLAKRPWRTQITKAFVSPFLRAVQTADLALEAYNLPENSICIENGLAEGAAWMGSKGICRKPWFLKSGDFFGVSSKIDLKYKSVKDTVLVEGNVYPGRPVEVEEFYDRCAATIWRLSRDPSLSNATVLIVSHAGCVMNFTHALSGRVTKNILHTSVTVLKTNGMGGYEIQSEALEPSGPAVEIICSRAHLSDDLLT